MVAFQREMLFEVAREVDDLLQLHFCELAKNQDRIRLKPDWERYRQMESEGSLLVFSARDSEKLVGYAAFFVCAHPHYTDLRLVSNDVLFLENSYRVGRTGVKFIRYCEERIRDLYASNFSITWHAKENTDLHRMLPRMGYGVQDIIFSRLY